MLMAGPTHLLRLSRQIEQGDRKSHSFFHNLPSGGFSYNIKDCNQESDICKGRLHKCNIQVKENAQNQK